MVQVQRDPFSLVIGEGRKRLLPLPGDQIFDAALSQVAGRTLPCGPSPAVYIESATQML